MGGLHFSQTKFTKLEASFTPLDYLFTLSECLFFFGIYSFHSCGQRRAKAFQFLEAVTPFYLLYFTN